MVALQVVPAAQRITISAMAPQESLILGQSQWIGILIKGNSEDTSSATLSFGSLTQGSTTGSEAYIYQVQKDGTILNEEWVEAYESGAIPLPDSQLETTSLFAWMRLSLHSNTGDHGEELAESREMLRGRIAVLAFCSMLDNESLMEQLLSDGTARMQRALFECRHLLA